MVANGKSKSNFSLYFIAEFQMQVSFIWNGESGIDTVSKMGRVSSIDAPKIIIANTRNWNCRF